MVITLRIIIDTIHEARQEHKHHQKVAEGSKATRLFWEKRMNIFLHFLKNIYHGDDKKPREADARHSFSQKKYSDSFVRSHHVFWHHSDRFVFGKIHVCFDVYLLRTAHSWWMQRRCLLEINVNDNLERVIEKINFKNGILLPKLFWPTVRNGILLP